MQILILGCGSSLGVPVLGCNCEVCSSKKPLNARMRSAILVIENGMRILIDFGADIRTQLLENNIQSIDAALLTHMHADHMAGIDDLRVFPFFSQKSLSLFTTLDVATQLRQSHSYLFAKEDIYLNEVSYDSSVSIAGSNCYIFEQQHGDITSMGVKIGPCAYCNDVSSFSQEGLAVLKSTPNWIIDCIAPNATKAHIGLKEVVALSKMYNPAQVYLTNMSHDLDYYELCRILPQNIRPLYDGMLLNF